jgi:hypothetical protein
MMVLDMSQISMAISVGTLAAMVYVLRVLVLIDRKIDTLMSRQGIRTDK